MDNNHPNAAFSEEDSIERLLNIFRLSNNRGMSEKNMETCVAKIKRSRGDFNGEKCLLYYASNVYRHILIDVVKLFIQLESKINDQDEKGETILHWVAKKKVTSTEHFNNCGEFGEQDVVSKLELIEYLVENGSDIFMTDNDGNDPFRLLLPAKEPGLIISRFMDIIRHGDIAPMSLYEVLNRRNKTGFTCLQCMISSRCYFDVDLFKNLIELGADPNVAADSDGKSEFEYALDCLNDLDIVILLIPSDVKLINVINDQPNRNIMYRVFQRDWRDISLDTFENLLNKMIAAGLDIFKDKLLTYANHSEHFRYELVEALIRKKVPVTVRNIIEAFDRQRFDFALLFLNLIHDRGKVPKIRTNYPDILCTIPRYAMGYPYRPVDPISMLGVIKTLLEKFDIDVNYSDENNFILHNLVEWKYGNTDAIFDYILSHKILDINKKIISSYCSDPITALDLALRTNSFNVAAKLIRGFASITDLHLRPPMIEGFTECYQLLYQLGVNIEFNGNNYWALQREVDGFKNWINNRKQCEFIQCSKVKPLAKLCVEVITWNVPDRTAIRKIIDTYDFPENVVKILRGEQYVPPTMRRLLLQEKYNSLKERRRISFKSGRIQNMKC